jgi:hypothetical protein
VTWSESTITWNNKPPYGSPIDTTQVAGTEAHWFEWDVTAYLRERQAAGAAAVTFLLRTPQSGPVEASFRSDESPDPALRPRLAIDAGPLVYDVTVGSSQWTSRFNDALRAANLAPPAGAATPDNLLGVRLPHSPSTPFAALPWNNLDRVRVRFSEDVVVGQNDLRITDTAGAEVPIRSFTYSPTSLIATWTLGTALPEGRLTVQLAPTVTSRSSNPLGGEGYRYSFNVVPGDADRNGLAHASDVLQVRARIGRSTLNPGAGPTAYSVFHDLTGDGVVNALDYNIVRANQRRRLALLTAPGV